jgi:hypothetical protein
MGLDFVGVDPGAAVTFRGGRYFPGRPLLSGTAVTFRDGGGGPGRAGLHCGAGQVRGGQVRDGKRGGQR